MAAPTRRRRIATALLTLTAVSVLGATPADAGAPVVHDGPDGAAHISLVGDSTLTGVRWYADYGDLRRFNYVFDAESCRRTVERSCISREGYRPTTVLGALRALDGRLGEVLVVMSGYNDPKWSIDEAIEGVLDEARSQGVDHVVWLSLRTSGDVDYSDPQEQSSLETFREFNEQLWAAAAGSDGFLQIADWASHTDGRSSWFAHDGVHLSERGVDGLTDFIAGQVDRVLAGENVTPDGPPWTMLMPGAEGDAVIAVQEALVAAGIELRGGVDGEYGTSTMVAVADYQRTNDDLHVTGAVDEDTARALGVHPRRAGTESSPVAAEPLQDPATMPGTTPDGGAEAGVVAGADPAGALASVPVVGTATGRDGGDGPPAGSDNRMWWALIVAGLVLTPAAVVVRRRLVIAQRRTRRWARVHPATSPRRSIADMRRSGELPAFPGRPVIYDHAEEDAIVVTTEPADRPA